MESREELQMDIEQRIDDVQNTIREQFFILGEKLYFTASSMPLPVGRNLLEECLGIESRKLEAEEKYKEEITLSEEFASKSNKLEEEKITLEDILSEERKLKIRLGAIIYERASSGLLDNFSFQAVYNDFEREVTLRKRLDSRNPIERLSAQNGLQKLQRNANERYISYSDSVIDNNVLESIGGNNAPSLIEELNDSLNKRKELESAIKDLQDYIDKNENDVLKLRKGGLEQAKTYKEDMENQYHESLISYGNYLFDKGGVWVGENTPSDVLDTIEDILKLQKEYADLNDTKQKLNRDSKADDYRSLIKEEEAKILILEKEKEKIDHEIAQIRLEIKKLNVMIDRL